MTTIRMKITSRTNLKFFGYFWSFLSLCKYTSPVKAMIKVAGMEKNAMSTSASASDTTGHHHRTCRSSHWNRLLESVHRIAGRQKSWHRSDESSEGRGKTLIDQFVGFGLELVV